MLVGTNAREYFMFTRCNVDEWIIFAKFRTGLKANSSVRNIST